MPPSVSVSGEMERRCGIRERNADDEDDDEDELAPFAALVAVLALALGL